MESSPKILKILFKNLESLVRIFARLQPLQLDLQTQEEQTKVCGDGSHQAASESAYARYLRQGLLLDTRLPAWLLDVHPDFNSFLFFQSASFETFENDYFNIVFRPANVAEWDKFYFQKTENLTRAIALMLANCRDLDAANLIFSMMCCRTLIYD